MTTQKEFQEKMYRYQILEESAKTLVQRRELFVSRMMEIESTLNTIQEIQKSKKESIFLPLGSSVYVPGTVKKNTKMVVGLGADVAVEKNVQETKKVLEERKKVLEDGLGSVEKQMLTVGEELVRLEPEIKRLLNKVQMQKV